MVILFGADFVCHQLVCRRTRRWFASGDEVGAWSSDGVLDDVGYEEREYHADKPAEYRDVRFVRAGAEEDGPEYESAQWKGAGVDEKPCCSRRQMWIRGLSKI